MLSTGQGVGWQWGGEGCSARVSSGTGAWEAQDQVLYVSALGEGVGGCGEEPLLLPALGPVFRWVIGACLLALLLKMIEVKFT